MFYIFILVMVVATIGIGAVIYEFIWVVKPNEELEMVVAQSSTQSWYVVGCNGTNTLSRVFYCTSADKALEMWWIELKIRDDFNHDWKIILVTTDYHKVAKKYKDFLMN